MPNNPRRSVAQDNLFVQRRFVKVGQRLVHYRTAGSGPPIVLIHQSPKSSAELIGMIGQLATEFTVFAPDTPGYGYSDPLDDTHADIDHFVDALAALFDALGLDKPALFGSHSGAIFGVRFAVRYPHKLSALIANGILINDQPSRDDLVANYFPDFTPDWQGSHLARVWSRIRDQHCYYPWYQRSAETRIHWPATLAQMHESAMEILLAGEHYKTGYRAVLNYDITPDLTQLQVPALLVVAQGDALVHYVPHYPELPACVKVQVVAEFTDITPATAAFAGQFTDVAAIVICPQSTPHDTCGRHIMNYGSVAMHYVKNGRKSSPAILLLHDLGQSIARYAELIEQLSDGHFVLAPDLSGHGQSDYFGADAELIAGILDGLLAAHDITQCTIIAMGLSQGYATLLAEHSEVTVTNIVSCETAQATDAAGFNPDLTPDFAGSQLLKAWYTERDSTLFAPWYLRDEHSQKRATNPLLPDTLQQRMLDRLISAPVTTELLNELKLATADLPDNTTLQVVESDASADDWHWLLRSVQA